jgi:hypothetical protein
LDFFQVLAGAEGGTGAGEDGDEESGGVVEPGPEFREVPVCLERKSIHGQGSVESDEED